MYSKFFKNDFLNYSDEELVKIVSKNSNAFNELISRYAERILIKSNKMTSSRTDRDDLIQEGFLGLMNAVYKFDETRNHKFSSFADVCIQNKMNTAIKKIHNTQTITTDNNDILEHSEKDGENLNLDNPEDILIQKETFGEMISILDEKLSKREFEILMLFANELSYSEISKKLNISTKSVDNAIQRVRRKIKLFWE